MLLVDDVALLHCPACRGRLQFRGAARGGRLESGDLLCSTCQASYEVRRGLAKLYVEAAVQGTDRLLRHVYDGLPRVHDPLVRFSFPFAVGETEEVSRARYLDALDLDVLAREKGRGSAGPRPVRILEIGAGTGSNVPLVRRRLGSRAVQLWTVDLSLGMLTLLRERLRFLGDDDTRAFAADAHALPLPDGYFDRVFHVGAINGYRDPKVALAEMARVARPGTPIVVVDERLDPHRRHGLMHRLFFRWVTIYDRDPHAPVEHLPAGARDVGVEQLGRFFYCLTFTMPAARRAAGKPRTKNARRAKASGSSEGKRPRESRASSPS